MNTKLFNMLDKLFTDVDFSDLKSKHDVMKMKAIMNECGLSTRPKCKVCGHVVSKFVTKTNTGANQCMTQYGGLKAYCSSKCSHIGSKAVRVKTNLEKYGVENPAASKEIKDKIKNGFIEKYGVNNPWKAECVKDKIKNGFIEKYGVSCASQSDVVKEKIKSTMISKYGSVSNAARVGGSRVKEKVLIEQFNVYTTDDLKHKFLEELAKFDEKVTRQQLRDAMSDISMCAFNKWLRVCGIDDTHFAPVAMSAAHIEISDYIRGLGVTVKNNVRSIIAPKELDIYCPDHNVAIEYNGVWCHSEFGLGAKSSAYHLDKTVKAEAAGINLLHILSSEWTNPTKQKIWKSIISNKLKINGAKIAARKCTVRDVSPDIAKQFLTENHLDGFVHGVHLGLYDKDELVQVLSYGKSRFNRSYHYEILRIAGKLNTNIVGGVSKLIKCLPKGSYVCFANRRYACVQNCAYSKMMTYVAVTAPNWFGFKTNDTSNLMSRHNFMKHRLPKLCSNFDETKTADENMINNGYDKIWDCGNIKYEFHI